jgi:N-acetyl-anhydromuramyl-L-alanine amidase AmpD
MKQRPVYVVLHATGTDDAPPEVPGLENVHEVPNGFHFLIDRQGVVHGGIKEDEEGTHTRGNNTGSVGIALVGRRHFSEPQMDALFSVYLSLRYRWGIESKAWYSCHEFDHRVPACIPMEALRNRLKTL